MSELLDMILKGRTPEETLAAEAKAIKSASTGNRVMTYDQKSDLGYVTAKVLPVPRAGKDSK
jgi:hypothetical protein